MTLVLHWWHIPLAITILATLWAFAPREPQGGNFPMPDQLFTVPVALVVSLIAWLIGALCK